MDGSPNCTARGVPTVCSVLRGLSVKKLLMYHFDSKQNFFGHATGLLCYMLCHNRCNATGHFQVLEFIESHKREMEAQCRRYEEELRKRDLSAKREIAEKEKAFEERCALFRQIAFVLCSVRCWPVFLQL